MPVFLDTKDCTDFMLLTEIVPDFEERLEKMKKERPNFFKEIRYRAVETKSGWRPLHWWRGFFKSFKF